MNNLIKKFAGFFLTGSFTFILAACYGAPVEVGFNKTIKAKNTTGQPIPDLKVTLIANSIEENYAVTSPEGIAEFVAVEDQTKQYSVKIEDVDGEKNGGVYKSQTIDLKENQNLYEVVLDK